MVSITKTASSHHSKDVQTEIAPRLSAENIESPKSSDKKSSKTRASAGRLATENGKMLEEMIRDIFKFKKYNPHSRKSKPDIFDPTRNALGEIKATIDKNYRVLVYKNQIGRYLKLAEDVNKQRSLDKKEINMSVFLFIGFFEKSKSGFLLNDVYVLGKKELEDIMNDGLFIEQKTKWRLKLKNPKLLAKINNLENEAQTLLSIRQKESSVEKDQMETKNKLRSSLLMKNDKGGYVRLNYPQLEEMCPNLLIKNYKNIPIVFHYSKSVPLPESEWATELSKATTVKRA